MKRVLIVVALLLVVVLVTGCCYQKRTLYQSEMSRLISSINMNDKFDMFFIYNNQYRIEFGKNEDLETKLELVRKIIDTFSDEFSSDKLKGTVNVSDITLGFVIFDSKVKLSERK